MTLPSATPLASETASPTGSGAAGLQWGRPWPNSVRMASALTAFWWWPWPHSLEACVWLCLGEALRGDRQVISRRRRGGGGAGGRVPRAGSALTLPLRSLGQRTRARRSLSLGRDFSRGVTSGRVPRQPREMPRGGVFSAHLGKALYKSQSLGLLWGSVR